MAGGAGDLSERSVDLGAAVIRVVAPTSPRALLKRALEERARSASVPELPFWSRIWPSAVLLGRRLVQLDLTGQRVIELGAGLGVAGLAAARAGADVLLTDRAHTAMQLARASAKRNGLCVSTALLDWHEPVGVGTFDLAVATEILYDAGLAEPLAHVLSLVVAPTGRGLVADPWLPTHDAFLAALERRGLRAERDVVEFQHEGAAHTTAIMEVTHADASA